MVCLCFIYHTSFLSIYSLNLFLLPLLDHVQCEKWDDFSCEFVFMVPDIVIYNVEESTNNPKIKDL
jgi:hypothetical protein